MGLMHIICEVHHKFNNMDKTSIIISQPTAMIKYNENDLKYWDKLFYDFNSSNVQVNFYEFSIGKKFTFPFGDDKTIKSHDIKTSTICIFGIGKKISVGFFFNNPHKIYKLFTREYLEFFQSISLAQLQIDQIYIIYNSILKPLTLVTNINTFDLPFNICKAQFQCIGGHYTINDTTLLLSTGLVKEDNKNLLEKIFFMAFIKQKINKYNDHLIFNTFLYKNGHILLQYQLNRSKKDLVEYIVEYSWSNWKLIDQIKKQIHLFLVVNLIDICNISGLTPNINTKILKILLMPIWQQYQFKFILAFIILEKLEILFTYNFSTHDLELDINIKTLGLYQAIMKQIRPPKVHFFKNNYQHKLIRTINQ